MDDQDGDGVRELAISRGESVAVVHPRRDSAGTTIEAGAAGPQVAVIRSDLTDSAQMDSLGDVDGDGRDDVMIAGNRGPDDQVA